MLSEAQVEAAGTAVRDKLCPERKGRRLLEDHDCHEYMELGRAALEAVAGAGEIGPSLHGEEVLEKAERVDQLVRWVDHTLTLPMFQNPRTGSEADIAASNFRLWRRLLTNGLHPSALSRIEKGRADREPSPTAPRRPQRSRSALAG